MRTIIRCPSCFTYVYDDARACHGCGERIGKRKILRRGSWVFIALIVCAYAVGRGIELQQERKSRIRSAFQAAERSHAVTGFLRAWLAGDDPGAASSLAATEGACKDELRQAPRSLSDGPPRDRRRPHRIGRRLGRASLQRNKGKITHIRAYALASKAKARPSASCEPRRSSGGGTYRTARGKSVIDKTWSLSAVDFEAEIKKDGPSYTALRQGLHRHSQQGLLPDARPRRGARGHRPASRNEGRAPRPTGGGRCGHSAAPRSLR